MANSFVDIALLRHLASFCKSWVGNQKLSSSIGFSVDVIQENVCMLFTFFDDDLNEVWCIDAGCWKKKVILMNIYNERKFSLLGKVN